MGGACCDLRGALWVALTTLVPISNLEGPFVPTGKGWLNIVQVSDKRHNDSKRLDLDASWEVGENQLWPWSQGHLHMPCLYFLHWVRNPVKHRTFQHPGFVPSRVLVQLGEETEVSSAGLPSVSAVCSHSVSCSTGNRGYDLCSHVDLRSDSSGRPGVAASSLWGGTHKCSRVSGLGCGPLGGST